MQTSSIIVSVALAATCLVNTGAVQGASEVASPNHCLSPSPPKEAVGRPLHAYLLYIHPLVTPKQFNGCIGTWIMAGQEPVLVYSTEYTDGDATKHTIQNFYSSSSPRKTVCHYKAGALHLREEASSEACPSFSSLIVPGQ